MNLYGKSYMMHGRNIKVILDTNLWISFLIGQKSASSIRDLLADESVGIVMTDILQAEIVDVASRPKFVRYFASEAMERLVAFLSSRCEHYSLGDIPSRCRDPKDDYLLELARVSEADILVTGDKDLTDMEQFGGCRIITLTELTLL